MSIHVFGSALLTTPMLFSASLSVSIMAQPKLIGRVEKGACPVIALPARREQE